MHKISENSWRINLNKFLGGATRKNHTHTETLGGEENVEDMTMEAEENLPEMEGENRRTCVDGLIVDLNL